MSKPRVNLVWVALAILPFFCVSMDAQQLIGTVNVGVHPFGIAVNPVTHKVYVANQCGSGNCGNEGSVTVIDETTLATTTVLTAGQGQSYRTPMAINKTTNKIYVATCGSTGCMPGTIQEIDGTTLASRTVQVGYLPTSIAVNERTNKIYVANSCGPRGCGGLDTDSLTVIDGVTLAATTIQLNQQNSYYVYSAIAVNPNTNKVYVTNSCGSDPSCVQPGSVSVVDGATLQTALVSVPKCPISIAVNTVTNKIWVATGVAYPPSATVIDGATLSTTSVILGMSPVAIAVDESTNQIYTAAGEQGLAGQLSVTDGRTLATSYKNVVDAPYDLAVNATIGKIYVPIPNFGQFLGSADGTDLSTAYMTVGLWPDSVAVDETSNRTYVVNYCGQSSGCAQGTVSVIDDTPPTAWQFIPVTPCRVVDTRNPNGPFGGPPIPGGNSRSFAIPQGSCSIPTTAAAYALNVTAVPHGTLRYLTIWPTGQPQPTVSTMNSPDGRTKANAAIVAGGAGEAVSVYATDTTDVLLDINGYFVPLPNQEALAFYPLTPCRVADTRGADGPLGGPYLQGGQQRDFPVLDASECNIPGTAKAYSLNFTALPKHILRYLTVWPAGQPLPGVSTLNDATGTVVANAAIVPAGTSGDISTYVTDDTDLLIDINGYFAPAGQGGLSFYSPAVCRVFDSRQNYGYIINEFTVGIATTGCLVPSNAQAYVLNATVLPQTTLGYLTLWPDTEPQPLVSTLNARDGATTSNMAIVPTVNGAIDSFSQNWTKLILDISGYFAP